MGPFIFVIVCGLFTADAATPTAQSRLQSHLFKNYSKSLRPVLNNHDTTNVNLGLTINQIVEVNEKRQTFAASGYITMVWDDVHLAWNPEEFDNITNIRLPMRHFWIPDVELYNSAVEGGNFRDQLKDELSMILYSNGNVLFVPQVLLKCMCRMRFAWFPFDQQTCFFKFGSWTHSGDLINLTKGIFGVDELIENGEWIILGTEMSREKKFYECCPEPYLSVKFIIHIKRKSFYYFFSLIVPCALIGFLALLGFTLPPDSSEKLPLGVTILFSLVIFLNMISETMPANADGVPLLGTYFCCIMLMIALSVVSTIVVNMRRRALLSRDDKRGTFWKKVMRKMLPGLFKSNQPKTKEIVEIEKVEGLKKETGLGGPEHEWLFAAIVVDKCCFVISIAVSFVALILIVLQSA